MTADSHLEIMLKRGPMLSRQVVKLAFFSAVRITHYHPGWCLLKPLPPPIREKKLYFPNCQVVFYAHIFINS